MIKLKMILSPVQHHKVTDSFVTFDKNSNSTVQTVGGNDPTYYYRFKSQRLYSINNQCKCMC